MKIEKLNKEGLFVVDVFDERTGLSFFVSGEIGAELVLKGLGYQKGASDNCWRIPGDIILDEDQRA
ncbi:MAG: hypothetical protein AAB818_00135 [Patescibacteria group bacterium]